MLHATPIGRSSTVTFLPSDAAPHRARGPAGRGRILEMRPRRQALRRRGAGLIRQRRRAAFEASRTLHEVVAWAARTVVPAGPPNTGWESFLVVAHAHGLMGAVAAALADHGWRISPDIDPQSRTPLGILARARQEARVREADLRQHLDLALGVLERSGVRAVPIKGGHLLAAYPTTDLSERTMVDIDIVVDRAAASTAQRALLEAGYSAIEPGVDGDLATHQLPPLARPGLPGTVDLHVAVARRQRVIDAAELLDHARPVAAGRHRVPTAEDAVAILIAHAMLHDRALWLLDLPVRAVNDLALFDRLGLRPDWDAMRARFHHSGRRGRLAFEAFIATADSLVPVALPTPEPVGRAWSLLAQRAAAHPIPHARWREIACLRQSLRPERMLALYGAATPRQVRAARVAHIARGVRSRVRPHPDAHTIVAP